jgi:3',5'-cyclic AMP phosphodiesterase CpdA
MDDLTLAHISDLHVGRDARVDRDVSALAADLAARRVDHVVLTGDVTHRGRDGEYDAFQRAFRGLLDEERITVVPGNHDRSSRNVAERMTGGRRVRALQRNGLYLVCLDSTAPRDRSPLSARGLIGRNGIEEIVRAFDRVPPGTLACLLLHHHVMPLPGDHFFEHLLSSLEWPWVSELRDGAEMVERIRGRCDLILHGHRHTPSERIVPNGHGRPLGIYNAGASPRLGRVRVFRHREGRILGEPEWFDVSEVRPPTSEGVRQLGEGRLAPA